MEGGMAKTPICNPHICRVLLGTAGVLWGAVGYCGVLWLLLGTGGTVGYWGAI